MKIDEVLEEGLRELDARRKMALIVRDEHGVRRPESLQKKMLSEYHAELKKIRRDVALDCHPDRTTADDDEIRTRKTRKFKAVTRAVDYLLKMRIPSAPTRVYTPVVTYRPFVWGNGVSSATSTSSTSSQFFFVKFR